jgi:hypothetical protein
MIDVAVVPPPRRPMTSSSIHAGPDLGAVGEHFAHAFVGAVEADSSRNVVSRHSRAPSWRGPA